MKKSYKKHTRVIDFYANEEDLYDVSKQINFQQFVKLCLQHFLIDYTFKNKYTEDKDNGKGNGNI